MAFAHGNLLGISKKVMSGTDRALLTELENTCLRLGRTLVRYRRKKRGFDDDHQAIYYRGKFFAYLYVLQWYGSPVAAKLTRKYHIRVVNKARARFTSDL